MNGKRTDAEQALRDYEQKIAMMPSDKIDLVEVEEEIRALLDARGREMVARAMRELAAGMCRSAPVWLVPEVGAS
jgi:hypothetical protein